MRKKDKQLRQSTIASCLLKMNEEALRVEVALGCFVAHHALPAARLDGCHFGSLGEFVNE